MRFVIDASMLIDAFSKYDESRRELALVVNGILLTNDRRTAENARARGLEAYYILEEHDDFFKLLGVGS